MLGSPFSYQITADNQPVSFDAVNLPPGLTVNRTTGVISGVPTISGFNPYFDVTAHGANGDASLSCALFVYRPVPPPDAVAFTSSAQYSRMVTDPKRSRIYALNNPSIGSFVASLVVLDPNTLQEVKSFQVGAWAVDFSVSVDGRTLWISRTSLNSSVARLDLDALDQVVEIPIADRVYQPQEGLDGRLYAAGANQEILQFNQQSGQIEQRFTPGQEFRHITYPQLAISPDRKTLYVADLFYVGTSLVTHVGLSRYDVSSPVPVLLQRVEVPAPTIGPITPDPSGESVFFSLGGFDGFGSGATHQTICVSAHDLNVVKGALSYHGTSGGLSITADGNTVVQIVHLTNGGQVMTGIVDLFDAHSFQLQRSIVLGSVWSLGGGASVGIGSAVIDPAGSSLIASTSLYPENLRKYDLTPPPPPQTPAKSLLNISTRLLTQDGDNVLIGGFIVGGTEPKKIMLRGIGTSLPLAGKLVDPVLELHRGDGSVVAKNDNWNSDRQAVLATGIAPIEEREAAIVASLQPGAYTVILHGADPATGIGIVEAYDLAPFSNSQLLNISTRGRVEVGDNVMIAGFILGGKDVNAKVVVRGIGPSLKPVGVPEALLDPMLELHNGNGTQFAANDNWRDTQSAEIQATSLAPTNEDEAAVVASLSPGAYTAILRGKSETVGVGLIEVYNLR